MPEHTSRCQARRCTYVAVPGTQVYPARTGMSLLLLGPQQLDGRGELACCE